MKLRLQKVLAAAGIASRRAAEDLIRQRRVTVNGRLAVLGMQIDPVSDKVAVDGDRVPVDLQKRYLMLNKPAGVITTRSDSKRRNTVMDLIDVKERVFPVGRLDVATEGLLVLTNDGDLAHRLAHPSFGVEKLYLAQINGAFGPREMAKLKRGVRVDASGRPAKATRVLIRGATRGRTPRTLVEVGVHEGRNHVVRKMFEASGRPVTRLTRIGFGPLTLGRLRPGQARELSRAEVASLYRAVGL